MNERSVLVKPKFAIVKEVTTRSYMQYCSVAHALDLVGERWALLMVRELILGPRRFRELHEGLPGISTNVLSNRLKELETAGVIRRRLLPRPASGTVYELTEYGRELEDIVVALGRWGAKTIQARSVEQVFKPEWFVIALLGSFRRDSAQHVRATYELRLEGVVFHLRIDSGRLEHGRGPAKDANLVLEAKSDSLFAVLMGEMSADEAIAAGIVKIDGDPEELQKMIELFALQHPDSAGAEP
jgi:DNA-binding HxlR family transcriptional regulator/putative sterol carrier protein